MPMDHVSICVPPSKLEGTVQFLVASLGHLGFKEKMRPAPNVVGMGDKAPYLWLTGAAKDGIDEANHLKVLKGTHVAIRAETKEQIATFHAAALEAGGKDNGPPGPRAHLHPGYYSAYVIDSNSGINFEVVAHSPAE